MLVTGDRVIVRGEITGTPAGELFGVPYTGKSFRIMAIDIQTMKDGKIAKTYHMENWLSALGQLRAKERHLGPSMAPTRTRNRAVAVKATRPQGHCSL